MSEIIFALFSPNRYAIPEYNGYDVTKLKDRVRFLSLLKTRDGTPDKSKALGYIGENGMFVDLPSASDMNIKNDKGLDWYQRINQVDKFKMK